MIYILIFLMTICSVFGQLCDTHEDLSFMGRAFTQDLRSPLFYSPLNISITPQIGSPYDISFTRATSKTVPDFEGVLRYSKINEVAFYGARRIENLAGFSENFLDTSWSKLYASVVQTNISSPFGTYNGVFTFTATNAPSAYLYRTLVNSGKYCISIYAKPVSSTKMGLYNSGGPTIGARFEMTGSGSVSFTTNCTASISSVGSGWYRCNMIGDMTSGNIGVYRPDYSNGDSISLFGSQVEFIGGQSMDGVCEYVSIGAIRRNKYSYSSNFSNNVWTASRLTNSTVAVTNPVGGLTSQKFSDTTDNGTHRTYYSSAVTKAPNSVWTVSCYFKAGNIDQAALRIAEQGETYYATSVFNLTGSGSATNTSSVNYSHLGSTIQALSDGWYRCSVSGLTYTNVTFTPTIMTAYGTNISYAGTGSNYVYAYGAQLEQGLNLTDYQNVTDASPADFNFYHGANVDGVKYFDTDFNGNKIPASILRGYYKEESKQNYLKSSGTFATNWTADSGAWTITQTNGVTQSPDGYMSGNLLTVVTNAGSISYSQSPSISSANAYTFSMWVKAGSTNSISFGLLQGGGWPNIISSGVYGNGSINVLNPCSVTGLSSTQWSRIYLTTTLTNGSVASLIYPGTHASTTSNRSVYVWGTQLEQNTFPSSYVPTTSSSVTRNSDLLTLTNVVSDTSGTMFAEVGGLFGQNTVMPASVSPFILDRGSLGRFTYIASGIPFDSVVTFDGTSTRQVTNSSLNWNSTPAKMLVYWDTDSSTKMVFLQGVQSASSPYDGSMGSGSLNIGGANFFGTIRNFILWNKRLNDEYCKGITR